MTADEPHYLLSRHVVPALYIGDQRISSQNISGGEDRLAHLDGFVEHLNGLAARGHSFEELRRFRDHAPFGEALVEIDDERGRPRIRPRAQAREFIAFNPDRVTIQFLDGRKRTRSEMFALSSGAATPALSSLISHLAWGVTRSELVALGERIGLPINAPFLARLVAQGVIEERPGAVQARRARQFSPAPGLRATWLGHAAVLLQCGQSSIWVDPYLFPVVRWQREEEATYFSPTHADSVLLDSYGIDAPQVSPWELPRPDAVFITHQDMDHLAPGVLMGVPEQTPIVVHKAVQRSNVDLDLPKVLPPLLGERPVQSLAHGESMSVGPFEVTAFAFTAELAAGMTHGWNCYVVEAAGASVVLCADSAVGEAQLSFLAERRGRVKDTMLMARARRGGERPAPGYRDQPLEVLNEYRLWGWYCPPIRLFAPVPEPGVSGDMLARLVRDAGVTSFFHYATGSLPWMRFLDPGHPLASWVGSVSLQEFRSYMRMAERAGTSLAPLTYGIPHAMGTR